MTIAEKISYIYLEQEHWHKNKLGPVEAVEYHDKYIRSGNIIYIEVYGVVLGYVEVWRINSYQLDRILTKVEFFNYEEDLLSGNIIYIANLFVHPKFRDGTVLKELIKLVRNLVGNCKFVCWNKENGDFKMFKLKGALNG